MLTVVTGPPCSGKSTYVLSHVDADADVVIDLDRLAFALGYPRAQISWGLDHPARDAARAARRHLIDQALAGCNLPGRTWIIDTDPPRPTLEIYRRAGADVVEMTTPLDECLARAAQRPDADAAAEQVRRWFARDRAEQHHTASRWAL